MQTDTVRTLIERYKPLSVIDRLELFYRQYKPEEVMCTSSFGAWSSFLLRHLAFIAPEQVVYFIETGNHFPETLRYRDRLMHAMGLHFRVITAEAPVHQYTQMYKAWAVKPDVCCYLKKTRPARKMALRHKVWLSGLMGWQNGHRAGLEVFEKRRGLLKFHPLIDVTRETCEAFIRDRRLPAHPLTREGYESIGCIHCTRKGPGRTGRWQGMGKSECGLHR